jgi:hypothetical protein
MPVVPGWDDAPSAEVGGHSSAPGWLLPGNMRHAVLPRACGHVARGWLRTPVWWSALMWRIHRAQRHLDRTGISKCLYQGMGRSGLLLKHWPQRPSLHPTVVSVTGAGDLFAQRDPFSFLDPLPCFPLLVSVSTNVGQDQDELALYQFHR